MITDGIKNIVEALIFASDEEITIKEIKDLLDTFRISVSIKEIEASIDELNREYENNGSAFEIINLAGGYIFATKKKYSHFLGKLTAETQKKKLSQSAIETLAIIAYKQPITRSEIEFVRGVNVDYIVNSLLERDLITIKGRADGPGRPILYGTTTSFLKVLGLNALDDLPKLKEINDILKNEKIEGISEADIDLFNSMSSQGQEDFTDSSPNERLNFEVNTEKETEQVEELKKSHNGIDFTEGNFAEGYNNDINKHEGISTEINNEEKIADDDSESKNEESTI